MGSDSEASENAEGRTRYVHARIGQSKGSTDIETIFSVYDTATDLQEDSYTVQRDAQGTSENRRITGRDQIVHMVSNLDEAVQ